MEIEFDLPSLIAGIRIVGRSHDSLTPARRYHSSVLEPSVLEPQGGEGMRKTVIMSVVLGSLLIVGQCRGLVQQQSCKSERP